MRSILSPLLVCLMFIAPASFLIDSEADAITILDIVTPIDDPEMHPLGFFRGILPNPYPGQDLNEVYVNASRHSQFAPVWGKPSPFYNLSIDLNGTWGDVFVDDLIRGNGMFPLVHMSFFGDNFTLIAPPSMPGATLNDPAWRQLYIDSALAVINASRPAYFSLGNEINRWFEYHGMTGNNSFGNFVSLYNATYDAVKALSPETKVFCTFSREIVSENREANMSVLELFGSDRMDLLVMTTYPFSVQGINAVSDLPDDYYSSVFDHFDTITMGFSEASWISHPAFGGEAGQSSFIKNITSRLTIDQGLDLELLGWPWLHDIGPTDTSGLRFNDGQPKTSLKTWMMNTEPTFDRNNRTVDLLEDFGTYSYDLNRTFSDPDQWDTLSYKIWNGTSYTNYTNGGEVTASIDEGRLVLVSVDNESGSSMLRIQVTDSVGNTNWTMLLIRIEEVNDPPILIKEHLPLEIGEGSSIFFDISLLMDDAEDEVEDLTFSILESPILSADIRYLPGPFLSLYTPDDLWNGVTYVLLQVNDTGGAGVVMDIPVVVEPRDDKPELRLPSTIEFNEDSTYQTDTTGWWSDPDGDTLEITLDTDDPDSLNISLENSTLQIIPASDVYGVFTMEVNVSDGNFYTDSQIEIRVIQVNDAPRFTSPETIEITEDIPLFFDMEPLKIEDPEGEDVFFIVEDPSTKIRAISFLENDTMKVQPFPDSFGNGSFLIQLKDGSGGSSEIRFDYTIEPVNDPPFFKAPDNWTIYLDRGEDISLDLTLPPYVFEDVDDPTYDLVLEEDSDWCQVDHSDLVIEIPDETTLNGTTVSFRLKDPQGAVSEVQILNIVVNDPYVEELFKLKIDNIIVTVEDGDIVVNVKGKAYQDIWAVIISTNSGIFSEKVTEDPNTPGNYYIKLDNLVIEDGEVCHIHLSSLKEGENETSFSPIMFIFEAGDDIPDKNDDDGSDILIIVIIILSVLAVVAVIFLSRRKKLDSTIEE